MSEILAIYGESQEELAQVGTAVDIKEKMSFYAKAFSVSGFDTEEDRDPFRPYEIEDGELTIKVSGMLVPDLDITIEGFVTGYDYVEDTAEKALEDPAVTSVKVEINSPGGYLTGMHTASKAIRRLAKAKPTFSDVEGICASAAYAIASGTNKIVAHEDSQIGSIGVMMTHTSQAKAIAKAGLKMTTFKSGVYKDLGSDIRDLTDKEKAIFTEKVNDNAEKFFKLVHKGRKALSVDTIRGFEAAIFSASEATDNGLIDELSDKNNSNKEKPMSENAKAITEADLKAAASEATAEGIKMEQARVTAILSHEFASANSDTVQQLISTGVTAEQASAILDTMKPAKVEKAEPKSDNSFEKAMSKDNPELASSEIEADENEADEATLILSAYKAMKG